MHTRGQGKGRCVVNCWYKNEKMAVAYGDSFFFANKTAVSLLK